MDNIQVKIIDPSVVVRQTLVNIIQKMPGVEVSGSWSSREPDHLLSRIERKKPGVVILGLDSPEQAEGELFLKIRDRFPALPVIVLTPLSEQGARTALFALKNGAVEFVTKPARPDSLTLAERHLEKRLHQTLKRVPRFNREWLAAMKPTEMDPGREPALKSAGKADENEKRKQMMRSALTGTEKTADLVVIGGCTGGIPALFSLIDRLSPEIRVPVVVVQHMPRIYTRVMSQELCK